MENKNRERALRAWETMKERGFHKFKDRPEDEMYNNPKKNKIRTKIVSLIKKYGGKNILTLETHNFMLPKLLKKNTFFVAEEKEEEYLKMLKTKPNNVFLHYGNVAEMCSLTKDFEVIYLDFCCGYVSAINVINELKEKIFNSKLVGFTFSLRGNKKEFLEDYTLDLIFKLQEFLGSGFRPIYKKSYADSSAMVTLFFSKRITIIKKENEEEEESNTESEKKQKARDKAWEEETKDRKRITKWAIKKINEIYPHIWHPSQIFDRSAKSIYIKNEVGEIIIERLFYLALKEKVFNYPIHNYYSYLRNNDNEELELCGILEYFKTILFLNIWDLWIKDKNNWKVWGCWSINWEYFSEKGDDLFLINKTAKKNKCFLCGEEKGIFRVKEKDFCVSCYLNQIIEKKFSEYDTYKQKTIISGENLFPKYSSGGYYHGSKICACCKKKICYNNLSTNKEVKIIEFNKRIYCENCFNNEIKKRLEVVIALRKDFAEEREKKKCKVYKLKRKIKND